MSNIFEEIYRLKSLKVNLVKKNTNLFFLFFFKISKLILDSKAFDYIYFFFLRRINGYGSIKRNIFHKLFRLKFIGLVGYLRERAYPVGGIGDVLLFVSNLYFLSKQNNISASKIYILVDEHVRAHQKYKQFCQVLLYFNVKKIIKYEGGYSYLKNPRNLIFPELRGEIISSPRWLDSIMKGNYLNEIDLNINHKIKNFVESKIIIVIQLRITSVDSIARLIKSYKEININTNIFDIPDKKYLKNKGVNKRDSDLIDCYQLVGYLNKFSNVEIYCMGEEYERPEIFSKFANFKFTKDLGMSLSDEFELLRRSSYSILMSGPTPFPFLFGNNVCQQEVFLGYNDQKSIRNRLYGSEEKQLKRQILMPNFTIARIYDSRTSSFSKKKRLIDIVPDHMNSRGIFLY